MTRHRVGRAYADGIMSDVRPAPPSPAPSRPGTPVERTGRFVRDALRALGAALSTPTEPGTPLLGQASSRWVRLLPYAVALACVASLLPVTIAVLAKDYGMNGGLVGVLATPQTVPLLLAVWRPLQAWWIVFTLPL